MAAIWEPTFCFLVSNVTCFHFLAAGSLPSSGTCAFASNSISDSSILLRVAVMVDISARCGSDRTEVTLVC